MEKNQGRDCFTDLFQSEVKRRRSWPTASQSLRMRSASVCAEPRESLISLPHGEIILPTPMAKERLNRAVTDFLSKKSQYIRRAFFNVGIKMNYKSINVYRYNGGEGRDVAGRMEEAPARGRGGSIKNEIGESEGGCREFPDDTVDRGTYLVILFLSRLGESGGILAHERRIDSGQLSHL